MPRRRIPGFGAGDVEAHHPLVAESDGQLGDLPGPGGVAHRGHQAAHHDGAAQRGGRGHPVDESGQHRIDHLVERQAAVDVQFGGESHLGVDHVVGGQIRHALAGDPVQRLGGLHHPDGVRERLEIAHQRPAVGRGAEELGQRRQFGGGQPVIPELIGQLEHGGGAQAAVEVVMQQGLGGVVDPVQTQRRSHATIIRDEAGQPRRSISNGSSGGAVSPTDQASSSSASAAGNRSGVSV